MTSQTLILIALTMFVTLVNTQNITSAGLNGPLTEISSDIGHLSQENYTPPPVCTEKHTVVLGDVSFTIATKRGLLLCELKLYNPGVNLENIVPGQELCMNLSGYVPPSNPDGTARMVKSIQGQTCGDISKENGIDYPRFLLINIGKDCNNPLPEGLDFFVSRGTDPTCGRLYTILEGDSANKIMRDQNLSEIQLKTINPGLPLDPIFMGNKFCVFARGFGSATTSTEQNPPPVTTTPVVCTLSHTVVSGDNLFKISSARGMTLTEIEALNPDIKNLNSIYVGQIICLNQAGAIPPSNPDGFAWTAISNGETCDAIATQNQITLSVFQTLNKEIRCSSSLPASHHVYVTRGLAPTCTKFADIKSGDDGNKIAAENNISLERLQILNPGLSMSILFPERRLCVSIDSAY